MNKAIENQSLLAMKCALAHLKNLLGEIDPYRNDPEPVKKSIKELKDVITAIEGDRRIIVTKEDVFNALNPNLWHDWLEILGVDHNATEIELKLSNFDRNRKEQNNDT